MSVASEKGQLQHLHEGGLIPELNERKAHGRVGVAAHSAVHDLAAVCKVLRNFRLRHLQDSSRRPLPAAWAHSRERTLQRFGKAHMLARCRA